MPLQRFSQLPLLYVSNRFHRSVLTYRLATMCTETAHAFADLELDSIKPETKGTVWLGSGK
jgi:hypothetical protein